MAKSLVRRPAGFLLRGLPAFELKLMHPLELAEISRHKRRPLMNSMGRDQQVHRADRAALQLKLSSYLAIDGRCPGRPIEHLDESQEFPKRLFIPLPLAGFHHRGP